MSDTAPTGRSTVMVCITCRGATDPTAAPDADSPRPGSMLADATTLAAAGAPDISVQRIRCLGNCSRGLSAAIRCENAWTYVFGGLDPHHTARVINVFHADLLGDSHHHTTFGLRNPMAAQATSSFIMALAEWVVKLGTSLGRGILSTRSPVMIRTSSGVTFSGTRSA